MEIWQGIVLGIVQGATEFLPISSSGHLFLAETWLGLTPNLPFTVLVHGASLLAVMLIYRRDLVRMIQGAFIYFCDRDHRYWTEGRLAWQLALATVCTVGVALLIEPYFEHLLALPWVAGTLVITGLLIVVAEKFRRGPHSRGPYSREIGNLLPRFWGDSCLRRNEGGETQFSWNLAIILGLVQGLAVIPGISRSGLTIALLILLGLNRQLALRISFLLSIPTILGALVFMLKDEGSKLVFGTPELFGCAATFATALLAIYVMQDLVERRWIWFAPYCLVLGGGILVWLLVIA